MRRAVPLALLALALLLPEAVAAGPETRIIVKREPGLTAVERANIRARAGVRLAENLRLPLTEVVTAPAARAEDALRRLNADPHVIYAELDRPVHALTNDKYYSWLWGLENTSQTLVYGRVGTSDADMDVPEAWELSTGGGQKVAVVDSGVVATHPDLAGQIGSGYDWVQGDSDPTDANGHGTHVTGTIAANRNNGEGVAGVAPDAAIMPLRVLDAAGSGFTSHTAAAFDYAGDTGVRVVNGSFGASSPSTTERNAIQAHPQTLYVVAAGNKARNNDNAGTAEYPCAYDLPNVLCVGASDENDAPATFSNFGRTSVDLFAPGTLIVSTDLALPYMVREGTSMATPHVAGLAALLVARNPSLTAAELKAAILGSADPVPALDGLSVTGGRANAAAAVAAVPANPDGEPPDIDSDGVPNRIDQCPSTAGPAPTGCPQPAAKPPPPPPPTAAPAPSNPPAAVAPPADGDRDGRPDATDRCPTEPAATVDGCPVPTVTSLRVSRRDRSVTISVRADRAATVRVVVKRKQCGSGKCRWVRVARRSVAAADGSARIRLRRVRKGRYNAAVRLSSNAGTSKSQRIRFRVR